VSGNDPKRGATEGLPGADARTRRETPERSAATAIEAHAATAIEPSVERAGPDALRARESEPPPRMVGRFEIHSLLGKGGMASVYRAFDPSLDRLVALKVLHGSSSTRAEDVAKQRKRIVREARAAAALTHPNTVAIYEVGEADGQPYIAMELLDGTTLRAALAGDAPLAARLRWLLEAARALFAAHERGLVHRDVKPDNMIVDATGRLRLLDFGIAKRDYGDAEQALAAIGLSHPDGPSSLRTVAGRQLGTPRYMAPEQRAGEGTDARTDQYAWGLVAFEVLTGAVPSPEQSLAPRLQELAVPEEVVAAIVRALSPRMDERASSMQPIIETLERAVSPSQRALPIASAAPLAVTTGTLTPAVASALAPRGTRRIAMVLGGLALLGGGTYAALRARLQSTRAESAASMSDARPASNCAIASSSPVTGFFPSEVSVASGFAGALLGAYERGQPQRPDSGVAVASAGGGSHPLSFLGYPPERHHGAFLRTVASSGPQAPFSFVALYNRDSDALLGGWRETQRGPGGSMPFGVRVMSLIATGLSAAPYGTGILAAFTGEDTRASRPDHQMVGLMSLGVGDTPILDVFHSSSALDAPALAVSPRRVAVAFRLEGKLLLSLFDDAFQPLGDAMKISEAEASHPAATYAGDTLLLCWAERVNGAGRLRTAMLLPGAKAIVAGPGVDDASMTTMAPVLAPLATGDTLIVWLASGADGIAIRAARFSVGTSAATATISRSFEVAPASRLRSLSAASSAEGISVGWLDDDAKGARLANVGCAPSAPLPAR
jgi:serine/threonine protein kinase